MKRFYFAEAERLVGDDKEFPFLVKIDRESSLTEAEQIERKLSRHYDADLFAAQVMPEDIL